MALGTGGLKWRFTFWAFRLRTLASLPPALTSAASSASLATRYSPPGAAISGHEEASETTRSSSLGGKKDKARIFEQQIEIRPLNLKKPVPPFIQTSPNCPGKLAQPRSRSHRGRHVKELGVSTLIPTIWSGRVYQTISARTRTSLKQVGRLPKAGQGSCLILIMLRASSPKKRVIVIYSLCQNATFHDETNRSHLKGVTPPTTPRNKTSNPMMPSSQRMTTMIRGIRAGCDSAHLQSRFKQAKKNTSGVANVNPRTPRAGVSSPSNPFGIDSYPNPLSISSSRFKTGRNNIQDQQSPTPRRRRSCTLQFTALLLRACFSWQ